jgi:tripartite-type tricarboxylate transporter receptor subunit TctC
MHKSFGAAAVATGIVLTVWPAAAQTPFYQGRQLKVLVGFTPGGGTDLFGRIIAEGLARSIEGKPTVLVQNMPGAGSVVASNYYVQKAPRDGSFVLIGTGQLLMRIMLGLDGSKAKISELEALVASPMGRVTYASPSTGIKTLKDILHPREPLVLGVPEAISTIDAVHGLTLVKANFRAVMGYPGKAETRLALLRNEVNLDSQSTPLFETGVRPVVKEGKAVPLFTQGLMEGDRLVRDPAASDLPTVAEAYREIHGVDPSGPAWEAYKAMVRAVGNGGKILITHSDGPPASREALRRAVEAMTKDQEFMQKAEAVLEGYGLNYGDSLAATIAAVGKMAPADIAWLQDLLSREFRMKFN